MGKKFLDLLSLSERKNAGLLLILILVSALLDMLGVASIMPFMAVLGNPELISDNVFLKNVYQTAGVVGVETAGQFLFLLGTLVFILLFVSLAVKALTTYVQLRFILMLEYTVGKRILESYLRQPYSWFLDRNSADLGKTILSEVGAVIHGGMMPMVNLIAQTALAIALLGLLFFIDLTLALTVGVVLSSIYGLIFKATGGILSRIGEARISANQARFLALSEAFGAAKELKVGGLEQFYLDRFSAPSKIYAKHQATAQVISQLPRFALEAVAFGGLLLVTLYLMAQGGGFSSALPIISLYAFAGYRLMPALQQIFGAITSLRFSLPALENLHNDLVGLSRSIARPYPGERQKKPGHNRNALMTLRRSISLDNIYYRYPKADQPALQGISITIPAKSKFGLVGSTGSGKTTLVDVILGLLEPQKGSISVDGKPINGSSPREWQRVIGYVPQHIYLADDSVAANIAFGVNAQDIDQQSIERAAKIANLDEFVRSELPQGYSTNIGERGVRLSGGQRQRIGIARALYHNPQVLILDEATSALDNLTERAVMDAVNNLGRDITIVLIAHRLSTVKNCDQIVLLERGIVKAKGTYDELTESNVQFRLMSAERD